MVHDIIPINNVSMSDIRDTLNANKGSVGNNLVSFFSTASNVNPHSKRKPVIKAVDFCQDFDASQPNYNATWWKGINNRCGFKKFNTSSGYTDLGYIYRNNIKWEWDPPKGGTSEPMRLGDFRGYKPSAQPFVKTLIKKGYTYEVPKISNMYDYTYWNHRVWLNTDDDSIKISDLKDCADYDFSNIKLCVLIYETDPIQNPNALYIKKFTSDVITNQQYLDISVDFSGEGVKGTYYALFGLEGMMGSVAFFPIPYDDNNYFMCKIDVVETGTGMFKLNATKIASYNFNGYEVVPLQALSNFTSNPTKANQFTVTGRGSIDVEFDITYTGTTEETFNTETYSIQYHIVHTNGPDSTWLGRVTHLNGTALGYDGKGRVTIKAGETVKMIVRFGDGGEMYPTHYPDSDTVVPHYISAGYASENHVTIQVVQNRFDLYIWNNGQ